MTNFSSNFQTIFISVAIITFWLLLYIFCWFLIQISSVCVSCIIPAADPVVPLAMSTNALLNYLFKGYF